MPTEVQKGIREVVGVGFSLKIKRKTAIPFPYFWCMNLWSVSMGLVHDDIRPVNKHHEAWLENANCKFIRNRFQEQK